MSKNRPFEAGIPKIVEKYLKIMFEFRTDYAAPIENQFVSRFFSAAKKDNLE